MKKLIFFLPVVILIACEQPAKQYFEESAEIDMIKKGNKAYVDRDWATLRSLYADTAKIAENVWSPDKFVSPDQFIEGMKTSLADISDVKLSDDIEYNMIVTNDGETWVLCWFNWTAKHKNGKEISSPVHLGFRIAGGKVVFQGLMYNQLPYYLATQPGDSTMVQ